MSQELCSIYKITNLLNGKAYIGFTSKNPPKKRWQEHIKESVLKRSNQILHKAIQKYGVENFTFTIIYQSYELDHCLNVLEPKFIKEYNTHYQQGYGYNMTVGGEGAFGFEVTEETKQKLSQSHIGKKLSSETRKRMSLARTGTHMSEISKIKMRELMTKEKRLHISSCLCHFTYEITYPDGHIEYTKSLSLFAKERGFSRSCLYRVVNGYKSHYKNLIVKRLEQ